ncbi:TlpA family protein disulfide reductase [Mucilaginibacter sp. 14171R-50]|uniref:TlpA family protein disulfide reductase n=1 Tax=Mucilaginibacter sp. 14171R-50 TaxID=2703789 RepID=UPI00138CD84F|nr:TlpA disulfide reductase family protein [Mucilaginibacter sp. 14171R-50]QHS55902.1 TlpA family protein disulfide reductase [Mucilaginibacter sp. 14171R-50]
MKNTINKCLLTLIFIFSTSVVYSQNDTLKEIHIGEHVPNIALSGFIDDTLQKVQLSNLYKNKLLILDFWATWCRPCISELTKLDTLKKQFSNQIEIVAVGYQSFSTINDFLKKRPELRPKNYFVLANDNILSRKLFPHKGIPHMVWIDSAGKVIAITGGEDVNFKNIKEIVKGKVLPLRAKIDIKNFDFTKTFHLKDSSFLGRSIFTGHTNGILSYETYGTYKSVIPHMIDRIFMDNISIRDLYWTAAFQHQICWGNYGRIILEIKDSLKYMQPRFAPESYQRSKYYNSINSSDWAQDNSYCYELQMPEPRMDTILYQYMISDLNRYLNLNGRFEKRNMQCYILKYRNKHLNILNESKKQHKHFITTQNVTKLTEILNANINQDQIVDETGIKNALIDFDINGLKAGITPEQINAILNRSGLYIIKVKRMVPVFVISEYY